jgi:hydrogenase maturation protein HypF
MLPPAPLHELLLAGQTTLVATSANISGEPLIYRNEDALKDLDGIVDGYLIHDRAIHVPVEDSVLQASGDAAGPIRRSRGYAPLPVALGEGAGAVLAVGGELKNTFTMTRDGMAFCSAHIGDMGSLACQRAFASSVAQMTGMHRTPVELLVADLHPGYATTAWAERRAEVSATPLMQVQHHHAHALSLLAEHGAFGRRVAIAVLDGTGYGPDATVWGGEILTLDADPLQWRRAWHLPSFWLPGGDSAVYHPWKVALSLLDAFGLPKCLFGKSEAEPGVTAEEIALVRSQLSAGFASVRSTSAGRLFDGVAALLGVRQHVTYEAQAAMELERLAGRCPHQGCASVGFADVRGLVAGTLEVAAGGRRPRGAGVPGPEDAACAARQFHAGLAGIVARALAEAARESGAGVIGLSGGVFQNRIFTADMLARLEGGHWPVLVHRVVPANDGGLSLGQALAGHLRLRQQAATG